MISLAEGMVIFLLVAALCLIAYTAKEKRREKELLVVLRRSPLYIKLYHKLDYLLAHYRIDQIRIEQRGVSVSSVMPAHTLLDFDFKQNGKSRRCEEVSRLVMQLIYSDFPIFSNTNVYKMSRYRIYRSNGKKEYGFCFTMRRSYKERLMRGRLSEGLRIL